MEITLSDADKRELRLMIREEIVRALAQQNTKDEHPEWVSVREAARIIGISEDRLRRTRDKYDYRRAGGEEGKGRLLFRYSSLMERYIGDD